MKLFAAVRRGNKKSEFECGMDSCLGVVTKG